MTRVVWSLLLTVLLTPGFSARSADVGRFLHAVDVGQPALAGSATFDPASAEYRITGGGANIWAKQDQFQFVWREVSGDFTAQATVTFLGEGNEHRKAGIMVRQSLDPDAAYADVVIHGNGMPGLQWRARQGDDTNTFDLPIVGPGTFTLKMVRTGVRTFLYVGREGAPPAEIVHTEVALPTPALVGLFVCAHDPAKTETAIFSRVSLEPSAPAR